MMETFVQYALTFLLGTAIGAAGQYFATKSTDKRRKKEAASERRATFKHLQEKMPKLIEEMKADISTEGQEYTRIFFLVTSKTVAFNCHEKHFRYFINEIDGLHGMVSILESHGFVVDETTTRTPKYRMTEEFVELLLKQ